MANLRHPKMQVEATDHAVDRPPEAGAQVRILAGAPHAQQLRETFSSYGEAEKALPRLRGQVDEDQHPKSESSVRRAITQWSTSSSSRT